MSAVEIRPVSGIAVEPWLDELANLRIRIFRDYPYLYDGCAEYERDYLDRYARSKQSVVVLAMEYNRLIGAATGLPLNDADPEFVVPFERHGPPPEQVFYFVRLSFSGAVLARARIPAGPRAHRPFPLEGSG